MSNDKHAPFLSDDIVALLKRTTLKQFSEDDQESFIQICQRTRLDPLTRQIYATRRMSHGNVTLVTVTGIQGLTALAERTGQYDGCQVFWAGADGAWKEEWLEEAYPLAAKAVVYHKGRTYPEVGIARWEAYVGRSFNNATKRWEVSDFWNKMPDLMLSKCARALALRGAFPDHLSGLYATEELDQSRGDEMDDERKISQNRAREEQLLKEAAAKGIKVVESKPLKKATPAEAAAPAEPLPEPPKPIAAAPQVPDSSPQEPDDLDMEPAPAQPEASAEAPAGPPAWKEHVIEGLRNPKFLGRKVGDLTLVELAAIGNQWIPKVRAVWDTVKASQKKDAVAIEAAIAHAQFEKPW